MVTFPTNLHDNNRIQYISHNFFVFKEYTIIIISNNKFKTTCQYKRII